MEGNLPTVPESDPASPPLAALRVLSRRVDCDACAAHAGGRPCSGFYDEDVQVVATAGHCIRPIRDVLEQVVAVAANLSVRRSTPESRLNW